MDINILTEDVKNRILDYLPDEFADAKVRMDLISKPEGVKHGITVLKPGDILAPTVYVEDYYNDSMSIGELIQQMAEVIEDNYVHDQSKVMDAVGFDISDYNSAKDKLFPIMLNKDINADYLKDYNYKTVNDIAIIAAVNIPDFCGHSGIARVTKLMQDTWNVDTDQLISDAISNMTIDKCILRDVTARIMKVPEVNVIEFDSINNQALYEFTNIDDKFGANAILSIAAQDKLCGLFPEGYFIIPSSVSECLIISKEMTERETIKEMLKSINDDPNMMKKDQILSYDIYDDIDIKNGKFWPFETTIDENHDVEKDDIDL